jgi:hypothetical protein
MQFICVPHNYIGKLVVDCAYMLSLVTFMGSYMWYYFYTIPCSPNTIYAFMSHAKYSTRLDQLKYCRVLHFQVLVLLACPTYTIMALYTILYNTI